MAQKRLFIFSAPSGAGKTTIARHLLERYPALRFSVSATTRPKRPKEVDGKDYYFFSRDEFLLAMSEGKFAEYEEFFGHYYGTLKSEINKALEAGLCPVFDIDVKGALSLRDAYPEESLLIFVAPPAIHTLFDRLQQRNTETSEQLRLRMERVEMEMGLQDKFDVVIINDDLDNALADARRIIEQHLRLHDETFVSR